MDTITFPSAVKLGDQAWLIESERNDYQQHATYYQHLRRLGLEYDLLDYEQALPFLQMLPQIGTNFLLGSNVGF